MSSRFNTQASRQRLFATYDESRQQSTSPSSGRQKLNGYAPPPPSSNSPVGAFSAYPNSSSAGQAHANGSTIAGYRAATPNSRGQYSDAVLSELESQNDEQLAGISGKVKRLKDLTLAIGDEIRDSTSLANSMNSSFDSTSVRLKNTMNRMLRMAEKTGVGWRVWLGFFVVVILLFWYVWLF